MAILSDRWIRVQRQFAIFCAALGCASVVHAAPGSERCFPAPPKPGLRVLFVGNSFTYFNNMPAIAEAVAHANGVNLATGLVASGGATLHDHLTSGDAAPEIAKGWDYVVLQEQSSFGDTYLVNGKYRVRPTFNWIKDAAALSALARKSGARPVLLSHWATQDSPEDGATIEALYSKASRETGACMIRASEVFARAEARLGRPALFIDDKLHPTPLKSYLIAVSVVRSLLGRRLRNLPTKVIGEPIEESEGKRLGGIATLVSLSARLASQIAVWAESVRQGASNSRLSAPAVPAMPNGQPLPGLSALAGTWSGPLTLYPIAATLSLTIHGEAADIAISSPEGLNKSASALPIIAGGDELQIVFPQGPNGTTIQFRARYANHGLSGLGHFRSSDGSLEGIGTFALSRGGKP